MPAAPLPDNEAARLEALRALRVLDTEPEEVFDEITALAADLMQTPVAVVSLVDSQRQWFKSCFGLDASETSRDHAFCAHAILDTEPTLIEDASADPRTADNPLVTGEPGIRFYVGVPLRLSCGEVVGTLCVIGFEPRSADPAAVERLQGLARICARTLEMRRSAQRFERAESELRSVQDVSPVAMFTLDPIRDERTRIVDYAIRGVNRAASTLTRKPISSVCGATLFRSMPGFLDTQLDKMLGWAVSTGEASQQDFDYEDSQRQAGYRCRAVKFGQGVVLTIDDISEERRQKLELEKNQQLLEQTERVSGVGGWSYDFVRDQLYWTPHIYAMHEVDPDYVPEVANAVDFYAPSSRPIIAACIQRALTHAEPFDVELEIITAKGRRVPVRAVGQPVFEDGYPVRVAGCFQDLTEMRAKQIEMDRNSAMLEAMIRTSDDLIFVKDTEGRFLYVNAAFERFVKRPSSEILGLSDNDILEPELAALCRQGDREALTRDTNVELEEEVRTKEGTVHFLTSKQPYRMPGGEIIGVFAVSRDITALKRKTSELERVKTRLQAITDASHDVIYVKDAEGVIEFSNPAHARVLGRPLADLPGTREYDMYDDTTAAKLREQDLQVIRTGEPILFEETVPLPGLGESRTFLTSKHPHKLEDGQTVGVLGIARDVTDYRRALDAARSSEARLNFAMLAANEGLWDRNLADNSVYYDATWYTMLGYEAWELPESIETWEQLCDPRDLDRAKEAIEAHIRGETPRYSCEIRLRCKDGIYRWVLDVGEISERDDAGRPTRMIGVHIDIDQRKRERDRLETALVSARQGIWEWNPVDETCYFDDQWYRVLGYEPGAMEMKIATWDSLCHPDDLSRVQESLGDYLEGRAESYAVEHRLWTKSDGWRWVLGTGTITERDKEGRPVRIVGVIIDIDDRQEASDRLSQALMAAEQANAAKTQFLANMSHEIRTPMTSILGYTEILLSDGAELDAEKRSESMRTIHRNGTNLLTLINDILDISKIEAGKMSLERIETDIVALCREVTQLMRVRAEGKGIDLKVAPYGECPVEIASDPARLRQILVNLVGNAVKFTETGSVLVRVRPGDERASLRIEVEDTGVGLSESQLESLFQPFQQADASMSRRFGGTGLGLSISKRLAELLGGNISVASSYGQGSTFTLELGLEDQADLRWRAVADWPDASELGSGTEHPGVDLGPTPALQARVLLAEDGPDNQRLLTFHLTKAGAEVSVARNGLVALEQIEQAELEGRPFEIVLMDMQMPEMDGYTATRTLREQGCTLPILALTAHAMDGDRERCLEAGCDDFVTKPVTRATLIQACLAWLGRTGGRGDASGPAQAA
ncbi:MAG: PAS domain-containing protein [Planctomycetota bacterium]